MKESKYSALDKFGEPTIEELISAMKYEYDISANIIKLNSYNADNNLTYVNKAEYNKDNQRMKFSMYYYTGELLSIFKYEYDKNGNTTKEEKYDDTGKITKKSNVKYEYNSNDQILKSHETLESEEEKTMTYITTYKYNNKQLLEAADINGGDEKITYTYNKNKQILEESIYNGEYKKIQFFFNKDENIIKEQMYGDDGDIIKETTYEYSKFDKKDNWIEKITYVDGKVKFIETREFTYR